MRATSDPDGFYDLGIRGVQCLDALSRTGGSSAVLTSSHCFNVVILQPVQHISFVELVFGLGGVPLLFEARRDSFQPILLPDPEPRFSEQILSCICALGYKHCFLSNSTPDCICFPWHTCKDLIHHLVLRLLFSGLPPNSVSFHQESDRVVLIRNLPQPPYY